MYQMIVPDGLGGYAVTTLEPDREPTPPPAWVAPLLVALIIGLFAAVVLL